MHGHRVVMNVKHGCAFPHYVNLYLGKASKNGCVGTKPDDDLAKMTPKYLTYKIAFTEPRNLDVPQC